jgi:hypothetical protein
MQRVVPYLLRRVAYRQRGIANPECRRANMDWLIDGMQRGVSYLLRRADYHQRLIDDLQQAIDGRDNVLK